MDSVADLERNDLLKQARAARAGGDRQAALRALQSASALDPSDVGTRLEMATELRVLNRIPEAEIIYREILDDNDKQLSALIGLGQIRSAQSDRDASLELFQRAEMLAPDHLGVKLEIGRLLRELGRVEEAEPVLRNLLDKKPQDVNAYIQLALLKRQQRDPQASLDLLQTAATLDPERVGIQLEFASGLRELGRLEEARIVLDRILERDPDNFGAHVGLGHLSRRSGDRLASLSHFERAAKVNPRHAGVLLEIAADQRELGHLADSKQTLETLIGFEPDHGHAHGQLGLWYRVQGEHQNALAAFEQAARCTPSNIWFRIELANCHRQLGNMAAAEAALADIVKQHPDDVHAVTALASLLMESYRLAEAKGVLERALGCKESAAVLLAMGHLFRRLDLRTEALACFERACAAEPGHRAAMLEVIEEHRLRGDLAKAGRLVDDLVAHEPSLPGLLQRGRILRDQGRHDRALSAFEEAAGRFSNAWQARLEMAIELRRLGRHGKAGEMLAELLAENPGSPGVVDQMIEHLRIAERFEEALELCRRTIALRPHQHWPYIRAAHLAARSGDMELASTWLDDAARAAGPHPEIAAARIELKRLDRRFAQAEAIFAALPAELSECFAVLVQGVQTAILLGDAALAGARLARARPQTALARSAVAHLAGKILEIGWRHADAIAQYRIALDCSPNNASAHWDLAKCQLLRFDPAAGRKHLKKFLELGAGGRKGENVARNLSQNHIGQLLDEFELHGETLPILRTATPSDPAELADLVIENPDSTPTAIALLLCLRQRGELSASPPGAKALIPRAITQFWDDPAPPAEITALTESWTAHNPTHAYRRFDADSAADYLRAHYPPDVAAAFARAESPAQQADIFRLGYLAREGGIYTDADDRAATALDHFLPAHASFVAFQEEYGTLGNNFIAAVPNHPVITSALATAVEAVNRGDRDIVWLSTGPGLLTRAFALTLARGEHALSDAAIFTVGELQRHVGLHCPAGYKSTPRHWLRSSFGARERARRG